TAFDPANCGGCGVSCAALPAHTNGTTCSASKCTIAQCAPPYYDVNGNYPDGCECLADGNGTQCNTPTILGSLVVGGSATASGNVVPAGDNDWFQITFTGNTNFAYHPKVALTTNPGNQFQFDVYSNCAGGTQACGAE